VSEVILWGIITSHADTLKATVDLRIASRTQLDDAAPPTRCRLAQRVE
jgi:hypothetical protein